MITPLSASHVSQVADLHTRYLRTPFAGIAGRRLLCAYYSAIAAGCGGIGHVAERAGHVVGFVCGVWSPPRLRAHLLAAHWPALLLWGAVQVARRPACLGSLAGRWRSEPDTLAEGAGYELRPIVVVPAVRGSGIAAELVDALIADARARGVSTVHLVVEAGNPAARAFYAKVGFRPAGTVHRNGIEHVRYVRDNVREAVA